MTLFIEAAPDTFSPWHGEPINGFRHQKSIGQKWSPEDLAAIGLYKPEAADPIPEGKISTGRSVQRVEGTVKWVHELADAPPPAEPVAADYPLKKWQFMAMVDFLDIKSQIEAAIDAIEDDFERAVVKARYQNSDVYEITDPLFPQIAGAIGMDMADVEAAWLQIATHYADA